MSNAQIATLAVGLVSITTGGNLLWSLIAIARGPLVGTLFMAAHSAQGPQLGLPQMIQSRPQFGYVGALMVWLFAYLQYAGFNVFNTVLAATPSRPPSTGPDVLDLHPDRVPLVVALVGYDFIHRFERWLTIGFIVIFGVFTVGARHLDFPAGAFDLGEFPWYRSSRSSASSPATDQLGDLRLGLLALPAAGRHGPQDLLLDVLGLRARWIWLMCWAPSSPAGLRRGVRHVAAIKAAGDGIFQGFGGSC